MVGTPTADCPGWRLVGVAWLTSAGGSLAWLFNWTWASPIVDSIGWVLYNLYYPAVLVGLWHLFICQQMRMFLATP